MGYILTLIVLSCLTGLNSAANQAPVWVNYMHNLGIDENTPVGTSIYTLSATDDGGSVKYYTTSELFVVHEDTGVVYVDRNFDYESKITQFIIELVAIDDTFLDTVVTPTIVILDVNDNAPLFTRDVYGQTIPEDFSIGFTVISNLLVEDEDYRGDIINVYCDPYAAEPDNSTHAFREYVEACATFSPVVELFSNIQWIGNIVLQKPLDYETRASYQIPLVTSDGSNTYLQPFEILLKDVNDAPPYFYNITESIDVEENTGVGTVVGWAQARDTDKADPRTVQYETTPCELNQTNRKDGMSAFSVDRYDGTIRTNSTMDKEEDLFALGLLLCVVARELNNKTMELGADNSTTSTTSIRISVLDLNDEIPVFSIDNYNASIYEDIPDGSPVPGVALSVNDRDQRPYNNYSVFLINYEDIFEVFPPGGEGHSMSGIKVRDSSRIDYERSTKIYTLYIVAEETARERRATTATVTVHVLDRNDNSPVFLSNYYEAKVKETDPGDEPIISYIQATDEDSGWYGTSGIQYSLLGSETEKFQIVTDPTEGVQIYVRNCDTPGLAPCLDYERRRAYVFTLRARDMSGDNRGREGTAELVIRLEDENDSEPMFGLNSYGGSIEEGKTETVDPLYVTASDPDQLSDVRYSLESNNQSMYWQVNTYTGDISATEPIFYRFTPGSRGWFDLVVIANDSVNVATANVRIDVIDQNNFAPQFEGVPYTTSILENTTEGEYVFTVRATDADPEKADNGRVEYNIEEGAQGKFVINVTTGDVYTAPRATFDYDVDQGRPYILTILARDGGNPQQTGTATLTVSILDMNNKLPFFTPRTHFATVSENQLPPFLVTTISATDLDANHRLEYDLVEPVEVINPDGVLSQVDYTDIMVLAQLEVRGQRQTSTMCTTTNIVNSRTTGEVRVAGKLDRDNTSRITYTMRVTDVYDPNNPQVGQAGQLQIHILEYNDQSPEFILPVYNLTVEEEQSIGTFIIALVARDEDDDIDRYEIVERDRDLFFIQRNGALTVNRRLDYETTKHTEFTVRAWDTGTIQRSGTAKVYVDIVNINDNSPIPEQGTYSLSIPEHTPGGTSLLQIPATDADEGDYGEIRYSLPDTVTDFNIDSNTGVLRLAAGAVMDREESPSVSLRVNIYDSPMNSDGRRTYNVPVYVTLSDINDNAPVFSSSEFISTQIIESIDIGAQVLQVFATDRDEGINAKLVYSKVPASGDPDNLFEVTFYSGQILVRRSLRGLIGTYNFNITVSDLNGEPGNLSSTSTVSISVVEALNSAPVWFIPADDNVTVEVLESQYPGMLVYDIHANDTNNGNNGIVRYYLQEAEREVSSTREFSINTITGVITANIVFDREAVDKYTLHLVAKDKGSSPLRTERFLNILVADVNDNKPEFPMSNGAVEVKYFRVMEDAPPGTAVGSVSATDRDSELYSTIYYTLIAGGQGKFAVGLDTGLITVVDELDRETQGEYSLEIRASNDDDDDDDSVITERKRRSVDPSIASVRIELVDINDEAPEFTNFNAPQPGPDEYYGCISASPIFDRPVVQLSAIDTDFNDVNNIRYDIVNGNSNNAFSVDETGLVSNRRLLGTFAQRVYDLTASATDRKWTAFAPVKVFVTEDETEMKMVINQNQEQVQLFRSQIIRLLHTVPTIKYACVMRITNHIGSSAVASRSDVFISAAIASGTGYRLLSASGLLDLLIQHRKLFPSLYDDLFIAPFDTVETTPVFTDNRPVLAVLIICLLLIVLALLLLCLVCCWLRVRDKRRQREKRPVPDPLEYGEDVDKVNPLFLSAPPGDYLPKERRTPSEKLVDSENNSLYATVLPKPMRPSQSPGDPYAVRYLVPDLYPVSQNDSPFPIIETEVLESDNESRPEVDNFSVEIISDTDSAQSRDPAVHVFESYLPESKDSESDIDSSSDHAGSFSPQPEPYQQVQTGLTPLDELSEEGVPSDSESLDRRRSVNSSLTEPFYTPEYTNELESTGIL